MTTRMLTSPRTMLRFPDRSRRSGTRPTPSNAPRDIRSIIAAPRARIPIAVVHHNEIFRKGLTLLLAQQPDIDVVASCAGEGATLRDARPGVVLLFLGPRDRDCIRFAASVIAAAPNAKVIAVGLLRDSGGLAQLVQAGVQAVALEDTTPEELLQTVRSVADGTYVLSTAMTKVLFWQFSRGSGSRTTRREREVMELIADGLSNKEMARRLGITAYTVKAHVRNLMEKLDVHTRLQIAAYAHRERAGQWADSGPEMVDAHTSTPLVAGAAR